MLAATLLGLAAIVSAAPFGTADDYIRAVQADGGAESGLTEQEYDAIKFYALHAGAAYCNFKKPKGEAITCRNDACPAVQANKPTVLATTVGSNTGVGAYVAIDKTRGEIVLAVRGSNNIRNFLADVYFVGEECDFVEGCYLHKGFADGWKEIRNVTTAALQAAHKENPNFRLVVTGHSLGGAVATVAGARLRTEGLPMEVYTYGSPRVGNAAFVNWFAQQKGVQRRVTHEDDPVPRLPPLTLPRLPNIPPPEFPIQGLQLPPLPPITIPSLPSQDLPCPPPTNPGLGIPGLPSFNLPLPIPKLPANLLPSIGPVADDDMRTYQYRHVSPEYWLTGAPQVANAIQNDYPLCYVKKCEGIANTTCNGGTAGFDIFAHLHYLGETSGCTGNILDL